MRGVLHFFGGGALGGSNWMDTIFGDGHLINCLYFAKKYGRWLGSYTKGEDLPKASILFG